MGYGKGKGKGKGTKKGNKICPTHDTYSGYGRPLNPVEIAAYAV